MFATQYGPVPTIADQPPQFHTPIHTPHHSHSSTRSHTPAGHALSIHEYRKKQATPPSPPSAQSSERRLKRRRAASGLNSLRTASTSSTMQTHTEITGALRSLLPPREIAGPTSFFSHIPAPSLASSTASQRRTGRSKGPQLLSSPSKVAESSRTGEQTHNFHTIKHLPRRQASQPEHVFATVSFSPADSLNNSPLPSGRPSTSSPTVSLSHFPQPPRRLDASSLAPSADAQNQHQQPRYLVPPNASPVQPPHSAPPTILHYRGASFDLVNPHQSLQLSAIETPDHRESDHVDYFQSRAGASTPLLAEMNAEHGDNIELDERRTPSRTLYNDLSTAHEAIATRSVRSVKSLKSLRDEFQRPDAVRLQLRGERRPPARLTALPQRGDALNYSKPERGASVRNRLSRAWRRGLDSFRAMDHALAQQGGEIATAEEQRAMAGVPEPIFSEPDLRESPFEPRHLKRISASMGNLGDSRLAYDNESIYPSSAYIRDDRDSLGYPPSIIDNRRSIPFGRITGQTDYTDSVVDVHSYAFDFSTRNSGHLSSPAHVKGIRLSSNKDSTIDNILDRYREVNLSDSSLGQLADDEDDLVRVSAMDLHQPITTQESTTTLETHISSNQSSAAPSPKTPDAFAFPPQYIFTSSEIPPPFHPPPQRMPGLPPFAPRFGHNPSGLSDMTSGDTYGDTRELLMLSQGFSTNAATSSNLQAFPEAAAASSEALAGVDDEDDQVSPEAAIRASPNLSRRTVSPLDMSTVTRSEGGSGGRATPVSPITERATTAMSYHVYATPAESAREYFDAIDGRATPRGYPKLDAEDSPDIETARRVPSETSPLSQRSSGVPRMWSGSPPRMQPMNADRASKTSHQDSNGGDSYADIEDDEDGFDEAEGGENEGDWETVAATSRQTLAQPTMSSMANHTDSFVASRGMLRAVDYNGRHNRSSSHYSDDPRKSVPSDVTPVMPLNFEFTTLPAATATPSPTQYAQATNIPITSRPLSPARVKKSDPQLPLAVYGDERLTTAAAKGKGRVTQEYRDTLPSDTQPTPARQHVQSWTDEQYFNAGGPQTATMSQMLSAGPNDDILIDGSTVSDRGLSVSPGFSSSPFSGGDPMQHEDSFSKLTVLGPKANLTGTPQGTNMREVGSSLANTSSPADQLWSSTPIRPFTSSPPAGTPEVDLDEQITGYEAIVESPSMRIHNRPGTPGPKSPKSPRSPRFPVAPMPAPPLSPKSPMSEKLSDIRAALPNIIIPKSSREHIETGNLAELREQKRRERQERELAKARAKTAKRASVASQTELREIQLLREHSPPTEQQRETPTESPVGSNHHQAHATPHRKGSVTPTSAHQYAYNHTAASAAADGNSTIAAGRDSSDTGSPLFERQQSNATRHEVEYLRQQANAHDQHLVNLPPAPLTEDLVARQQTISWVLFGCAALLPPLLILYRWEADPVVAWTTNGRVLTASAGPKKLAPWVGVGVSVIILIAAVIVVVLWQVGVIL